MEVYIDNVVVKSKDFQQHLVDLKQALQRMRFHNLKMNPAKCHFGVMARNFLRFLVHSQDIGIDKNKAKAIIEASSPRKRKELHSLICKINFLRWFIANSAGKMKAFSPYLG